MRIAHIITGLRRGGAEMMLYRLIKAHHDLGVNSIVYSLNSNGELKSLFESSGIEVVDLNFSTKKLNMLGVFRLQKALKKVKPDLVQCWMYHGNFFGLIATRLSGRYPVIWNIRNSTLDVKTSSKVTILIMKACGYLSSLPQKIISCSENAKLVHIKEGYREEKFTVIPNGIDVSLFLPNEYKGIKLRTSLGLQASDHVIGIAGRYDPQKDYATFVNAASLLSGINKRIHFVLCGNEVNENNFELMQMVDQVNLKNKVHLLGHQPKMEEIYPIMDVFVSTSAYGEAFPNVIAEAMACGVPCVSTDVGDAAYIIGEAGKVVPPQNPQAIANAVQEIMQLPEDVFSELKKKARKRIVDHFSLPVIAEKYIETYEDVIKKR